MSVTIALSSLASEFKSDDLPTFGLPTISMGIDISNLEQLDNIMNKIKRMKGVYSVERMISNGQGG